jgi:hypothetical protein
MLNPRNPPNSGNALWVPACAGTTRWPCLSLPHTRRPVSCTITNPPPLPEFNSKNREAAARTALDNPSLSRGIPQQ